MSSVQAVERDALFETWKVLVNNWVVKACGCDADDLPDVDYYEMFEQGYPPRRAANVALRAAGF